ncbi:MAG: (deoxy)nucleoside triphosphate pyrophosphohydrolase [Polyangiaceae bacterium]|nr:(deoxy)nucleoside triphosphate pyrophosphohydrolase [Polyangiaceae bacterium]MCW5791653.1 (deoxy)nucleoside triphosphate pyrophosphohydrolase [Polyangiaceae bacterium]
MRREIALALVWHQGRILIAKRARGAHQGGLWEFPGGKIEPGETAAQAATREVLEETGLRITSQGERARFDHDYGELKLRFIAVDCQALSPDARPLASDELCWVPPSELSAYAFPEANRALIEALLQSPAGPSGAAPDA